MDLGDPETISLAFYHGWVSQCIDLALLSIVVFEWMITLNLEVSLVWNSRWSVAKVAFLLNRYSPIIDFILKYIYQNGFAINCKGLLYAEGCVYFAGLGLSEYTLALRTCVIWNMNKKIVTTLVLTYAGGFVFAAYNYFHLVATREYFPSSGPLGGCTVVPAGMLYLDFIVLALYDAVVLGLMLYPTVKQYTSASQEGVVPRPEFMKIVYTEGTLFYAYLLLLSLISVIIVVRVPDNVFLFILTSRMMRAVFACRVLLHLRELSTQRHYYPPSTSTFDPNSNLSRVLSELKFARVSRPT